MIHEAKRCNKQKEQRIQKIEERINLLEEKINKQNEDTITKCDIQPQGKNYYAIKHDNSKGFYAYFPIPYNVYPCITCESFRITLKYDKKHDLVMPFFKCEEDLL